VDDGEVLAGFAYRQFEEVGGLQLGHVIDKRRKTMLQDVLVGKYKKPSFPFGIDLTEFQIERLERGLPGVQNDLCLFHDV
jgi:hypothetical protein